MSRNGERYVATTSLAGSNATLTMQTDVTNESGSATAERQFDFDDF